MSPARFQARQRAARRGRLAKRDAQGIRVLAGGRPATLVVGHAGADTEDADALHLMSEMLRKVGIKMHTIGLYRPDTFWISQ